MPTPTTTQYSRFGDTTQSTQGTELRQCYDLRSVVYDPYLEFGGDRMAPFYPSYVPYETSRRLSVM